MTDADVERVARRLCEIRGWKVFERGFGGGEAIPLERARDEVRAFHEIATAFRHEAHGDLTQPVVTVPR